MLSESIEKPSYSFPRA